MTLKKCTCGKDQTTKNSQYLGKSKFKDTMLFFNCTSCRSTFVIKSQKKNEQEARK